MLISEIDIVLEKEWQASAKLCKSSTPNNKLGASALSSCKAQGYRARETGKSQKIGKKTTNQSLVRWENYRWKRVCTRVKRRWKKPILAK